MAKVNFFIAGAPKCGTTALSEYLRGHPQICFAQPKETGYFDEFTKGFIGSERAYEDEFFSDLNADHRAVGEGSVWYLYSQKAFLNIRQYNPNARIIIMLRNPVEMVYSLHSQNLYTLDEKEKDFRKAWQLQDCRKKGEHIPPSCRDPELLQYKQIGLYSQQLKRLYSVFSADQVKVIFFDEFIRDTEAIYRQVLSFLKVEQDGRSCFPRVNENKIRKNKMLAHLIVRLGKFFRYKQSLRKMLHGMGIRILPLLDRLNSQTVQRHPLDSEMRAILVEAFREDIKELSAMFHRDLSRWLRGKQEKNE